MIPITHPFRKVREKDGAPGLDVAGKKFEELVSDSERQGFKKIAFMDIVEFEEKACESKK
jgi:hypothetical protein